MAISTALYSAVSGLSAAQTSLNVVSRNIANASTEGYTRKISTQTNQVLGGASQGVTVSELRRSVDEGLQADVRDETSRLRELEVLDDFMARLDALFGRPEDDVSIAAKITDLKDTMIQFATTPDFGPSQSEVVRAAEALVTEFNDLTVELQQLRQEADSRIVDSVAVVNSTLTSIDSLNTKIAAEKALGNSAVDLIDLRDGFTADLADEMSVKSLKRGDGQVTILTASGRLMLDETKLGLSFNPTVSYTTATTGQPLRIENGAPTSAGYPSISSEITANDGRLAALLDLRDTILPQAQAQLDSLAFELAQDFGTITIGGTNAVLNLFVVEGTQAVAATDTALAGNIGVRDAVAANPTLLRSPGGASTFTATGPGDPTLPLAMVGLFETTQTFTTSFTSGIGVTTSDTIEGFAAQIIGFQANQRADFETQLDFQGKFRDNLNNRLQSKTGVNIDEEMAELIELEQNYAASARVLSAVQRAIDELLSALR